MLVRDMLYPDDSQSSYILTCNYVKRITNDSHFNLSENVEVILAIVDSARSGVRFVYSCWSCICMFQTAAASICLMQSMYLCCKIMAIPTSIKLTVETSNLYTSSILSTHTHHYFSLHMLSENLTDSMATKRSFTITQEGFLRTCLSKRFATWVGLSWPAMTSDAMDHSPKRDKHHVELKIQFLVSYEASVSAQSEWIRHSSHTQMRSTGLRDQFWWWSPTTSKLARSGLWMSSDQTFCKVKVT